MVHVSKGNEHFQVLKLFRSRRQLKDVNYTKNVIIFLFNKQETFAY